MGRWVQGWEKIDTRVCFNVMASKFRNLTTPTKILGVGASKTVLHLCSMFVPHYGSRCRQPRQILSIALRRICDNSSQN